MLGKNRDRLSIVVAILEAANSGASKTRLMLGANLSFGVMEKYLGVVLDAGFVRAEGGRFVLTERGRGFLRQYRRFIERYIMAQKSLEALDREREKLDLMCEASGFAVLEGSQKQVRPKSPIQA